MTHTRQTFHACTLGFLRPEFATPAINWPVLPNTHKWFISQPSSSSWFVRSTSTTGTLNSILKNTAWWTWPVVFESFILLNIRFPIGSYSNRFICSSLITADLFINVLRLQMGLEGFLYFIFPSSFVECPGFVCPVNSSSVWAVRSPQRPQNYPWTSQLPWLTTLFIA